MAEQKVELRRIRDLSENLNDTFWFIRQNLKPLIGTFLAIAGIFMLANSIFTGIYESKVGGVLREVITNGEGSVAIYRLFSSTYPIVMVLTWLNVTAMQVVIASYMKTYEMKQRETPSLQEVWDVFKQYYLTVLLYSVPVYLSIFAGLFFCIIPGIYLFVVFTPFTNVVMMEERTFASAYSRCFEIIRNNFWASFLTYVLVYIIYSFAGGIISSIMAGISGLLSYFTTNNISTTIGTAASVLSVFTFVFYVVYYVSVTLHYFSLAEKLDGTGMLQRLDKLGENGNDFNNIQEHY